MTNLIVLLVIGTNLAISFFQIIDSQVKTNLSDDHAFRPSY